VCFGQDNLLYFIFGRYWMEPSRSRTWTNPSLKTIEEELIQLDPFKNQVKNPLIFFLNYFLSKRRCFEKKILVKTMLLWIFFYLDQLELTLLNGDSGLTSGQSLRQVLKL
jgi:hypothetical protein